MFRSTWSDRGRSPNSRMLSADSRSTGLARIAAAVLVLLFCATDGVCQEGGRDSQSVGLELDSETVRLLDGASLRDWVARDLHQRLGLAASDELAPDAQPRHMVGTSIYTIRQQANGLPVVKLESRLTLDQRGQPIRLLGHHRAFSAPPSATPSVAARDILEPLGVSEGDVSSQRLVYWPDGSRLRLSYEIEGVFDDGNSGYERIYVDAHSGEVLERLPVNYHALDRRIYDFERACRSARIRSLVNDKRSASLVGMTLRRHLVRNETSGSGRNPSADKLFGLFGGFHEFLLETLDMNSFDDAGGAFKGIVDARFHAKKRSPQCIGEQFNALWIGPLRSVLLSAGAVELSEMVGHELGHGLIDSGSRLIYQGESGALNESIADSIGVAFRGWIETEGRLSSRLPADIWRIRGPNGPLRDMSNPQRVNGLPNHYRDYRFLRTDVDYGGVHINSSIMNQGFYLLAMGGRHPDIDTGPEVSGIGLAKALQIFGRAAFNILTPNSNFTDAREALAHTAEILHGKDSPEWVATHTAMDAIGIPGYWQRPAIPSPNPVTDDGPIPETTAVPESRPESASEPDIKSRPKPAPEPVNEPEEVLVPQDEPTPLPETKLPRPSNADAGQIPKQDLPRTTIPTDPSPIDTNANPPPSRSKPGESQLVPTIVAAVLLLLAVTLTIAKARAQRRTAYRRAPTSDVAAPAPRSPPAANRSVRRVEGNAPSPWVSRQTAGALVPLDGSRPIPLPLDLLRAPMGLVIGRASELCDVRISDIDVSRRHLRCRLDAGTVWIEDLNSKNGTEIDGERVETFTPREVSQGQIVRIGKYSYALSIDDRGQSRSSA